MRERDSTQYVRFHCPLRRSFQSLITSWRLRVWKGKFLATVSVTCNVTSDRISDSNHILMQRALAAMWSSTLRMRGHGVAAGVSTVDFCFIFERPFRSSALGAIGLDNGGAVASYAEQAGSATLLLQMSSRRRSRLAVPAINLDSEPEELPSRDCHQRRLLPMSKSLSTPVVCYPRMRFLSMFPAVKLLRFLRASPRGECTEVSSSRTDKGTDCMAKLRACFEHTVGTVLPLLRRGGHAQIRKLCDAVEFLASFLDLGVTQCAPVAVRPNKLYSDPADTNDGTTFRLVFQRHLWFSDQFFGADVFRTFHLCAACQFSTGLSTDTAIQVAEASHGTDSSAAHRRSMHKNTARYGPIRRAVIDKNASLLTATIRARCLIDADDDDACWIWSGARVPSGYGFVGRGSSRHFTHRLHYWSSQSFVGELHNLDSIHHLCGQRACVRIEHLAPVSAFMNTIEAGARGVLLSRIKSLQGALRSADPTHQLLRDGWAVSTSTLKAKFNTPATNLSDTERLRLAAKRENRRAMMQANQEFRFGQVLAVRAIKESGVSTVAALKAVGISRSGYCDWGIKLDANFRAEEL